MGMCRDSMIVARLVPALAAGAIAAALLAGCAGTGSDTATPGGSMSTSPSASPSGPVPTSGAPTPSPSSTLRPTGGATAAADEVTLTGELQEGVEAGCTLLRTSNGLYLLLGGDRSKMQGSTSSRVTVIGKPATGVMTTCQQGTPFQVREMRPA
jgi:hypothetical protein